MSSLARTSAFGEVRRGRGNTTTDIDLSAVGGAMTAMPRCCERGGGGHERLVCSQPHAAPSGSPAAVDVMIVHSRVRPGLISTGIAATAVAVGLAVIASGINVGWQGLHGLRLVAFLIGGMAFVTAAYLLQRTLRRQARLDVIADLLPNYRLYRRHADELLFDEPELDDDLSARVPMARGESGAAARALLVSLEDEMRRDVGRMRRNGRLHCRHARLRAAGRSESRRRRIPARFATTPS